MEIKEFIDSLGIDSESGVYKGDSYTLNIKDSNEYSKIYSILDKSSLVDLDPASTKMEEGLNEMTYLGDEFDVIIQANFTKDLYRIIFKRGI